MGRIGFACKIIGIPYMKMRTCMLRNANEQNLIDITNHNLDVLDSMVTYCYKNNIKLMRISSDIIPFASHKDVNFNWPEHFSNKLKLIGKHIRQDNLRISMHPGQYTVLNGINDNVVDSAIRDITWHSDFLDSLNADNTSKIILHLGGVYNDRDKAIERFIKNFNLLQEKCKDRIAVENDEKNYNINDVIFVSEQLKIPAVFDVLHHELNSPINGEILYWIIEASKTWSKHDGSQKIHYSQQKTGGKQGAHSDTIDVAKFIEFYKQIINMDIDVMLEVKDKNISAVKCIDAIKSIL